MEYEWDINEINGLFMVYGNFTGICRISSPGTRIHLRITFLKTPVGDFLQTFDRKKLSPFFDQQMALILSFLSSDLFLFT